MEIVYNWAHFPMQSASVSVGKALPQIFGGAHHFKNPVINMLC